MQGFSNYSHFSDVPSHFVPQGNTHYRIVSALDITKALTVTGPNHTLTINNYTGDASQRFIIMPQGKKYALVVQSTNTALCIYFDNKQNSAEVRADPGKHNSSWFDIERVAMGELVHKGYIIGTFSFGKCLDVAGGAANNGNNVLQWEKHNGPNQVWLIVPADQNKEQWGGKSGHGHGHHGHKDHHHHEQKSGSSNQGFGFQMQGLFKKNFSYALLSCANQNKCVHINHDNTAKIFDFQGSLNQKFTFVYDQQHKKYFIKCIGNGQYLSGGSGLFAGSIIKTKPKCELGEQWTIEPSNNAAFNGPAFNIKSYSSHAIDVPNNNFTNGTQLEKHGFHNAPNQTWYIIEK